MIDRLPLSRELLEDMLAMDLPGAIAASPAVAGDEAAALRLWAAGQDAMLRALLEKQSQRRFLDALLPTRAVPQAGDQARVIRAKDTIVYLDEQPVAADDWTYSTAPVPTLTAETLLETVSQIRMETSAELAERIRFMVDESLMQAWQRELIAVREAEFAFEIEQPILASRYLTDLRLPLGDPPAPTRQLEQPTARNARRAKKKGKKR